MGQELPVLIKLPRAPTGICYKRTGKNERGSHCSIHILVFLEAWQAFVPRPAPILGRGDLDAS